MRPLIDAFAQRRDELSKVASERSRVTLALGTREGCERHALSETTTVHAALTIERAGGWCNATACDVVAAAATMAASHTTNAGLVLHRSIPAHHAPVSRRAPRP
jgi:hypothetical protein